MQSHPPDRRGREWSGSGPGTKEGSEGRLEGLGPEAVTAFVGVEKIGHDVRGKGAVGLEEAVVKIQEVDGPAVGEGGEGAVDLGIAEAGGIVGGSSTGEDGEEEDGGSGEAGAEFLEDGADASHGFGGRVHAMAGIVGADKEDGKAGSEAIDLAAAEAPEDLLGAVAGKAEIEGAAGSVEFLPDREAGFVPGVGNGIAEPEEVDGLGAVAVEVGKVAIEPPTGGPVGSLGKGVQGGDEGGVHGGVEGEAEVLVEAAAGPFVFV